MSARLRICHVITTTSAGGAEKQLLTLLANSPPSLEHTVVGLQAAGELAPAMEQTGTRVISLGLRPGVKALLQGPGLVRRALQKAEPQVAHTWLYHADLFGALAKRPDDGVPLVWGLRNSDLRLSKSTSLVVKACVALASRPAAIVANSRSGADWHAKLGYPAAKIRVIPNGFDTERFRPDDNIRQEARAALSIPADALVVGRVARLDAAKDYAGLAAAASQALQKQPRLFFLLVGRGIEKSCPQMEPWSRPPLAERSLLLGYRDDIPYLLNAMDLHLSNSLSEGLSNVVGEAMASGLPSLVTDVGDCREMIGDAGRLVTPGDPAALAEALVEMTALGREHLLRLGQAARARVNDRYSISAMVTAYEGLYRELCGEAAGASV